MVFRLLFFVTSVAAITSVLAYRSDPDWLAPPWIHPVSTEVGIEPPHNRPYDSSRVHASGVVEGGAQPTELRFEVHGRITHLACSDERKRPQFVRQGDILGRIDYTCALQAVREAEAMLAKARAEKARLMAGASAAERDEARAYAKAAAARVVAAFNTHRRLRALSTEQVVTDQDLEDATAEYSTAHARWAAAKARVVQLEDPPRAFEIDAADAEIALAVSRVGQTKATLRKSVLRAPCDAVVLRVEGEVGELTGPEAAEPIVTLVDATALHVRAYVDELDALEVEPGQPAEISVDSLPDVRFRGHVEACLASMQPKTLLRHGPTEKLDVKVREIVIKLDADNHELEQLVYGLPVEVMVHTGAKRASPVDSRDSDVLQAAGTRAPGQTRLASTP